MGPPSYRCCQTVYAHGQFLHQCKMSAAERDEINNPEDYPGVSWRLASYRDGKRWERVVKPKYGCAHEEHVSQVCTCPKFKPNYNIDLDKFYPTIELKDTIDVVAAPVMPECGTTYDAYELAALRKRNEPLHNELRRMHMQSNLDKVVPDIPWWQPFRRMKFNWLVNNMAVKQQRECLDRIALERCEQSKANDVFDYVWFNRFKYPNWSHRFRPELIEQMHPIMRVIEDRYGHVPNGESIPDGLKFRLWKDFFRHMDLSKYFDNEATYSKLIKPLMDEALPLMRVAAYNYDAVRDGSYYLEVKMGDGISTRKYENLRCVDGKWTINIGGKAVPVVLGGRPSNLDLVMEPFYNFNSEGFGSITLERGSVHPIQITYDSDYHITKVVRTDNREALDGFSVIEGHVLLDMLIVQVSASRAINGNSLKTR